MKNKVVEKNLEICYVLSCEQIAYGLTKVRSSTHFHFLKHSVVTAPSSLKGGVRI